MSYGNIPLIIPVLATGYLLTIYLLLLLAQRTVKKSSSATVTYNSNPPQSH